MIFLLRSINIVKYYHCFPNNEPSLHSHNKPYLVMMYFFKYAAGFSLPIFYLLFLLPYSYAISIFDSHSCTICGTICHILTKI